MPNPLPPNVAESDLSREIQAAGLVRVHQGKVRDTYRIPGHENRRLVVTTDRTSSFDFVLNQEIPDKGKVLNAVNVFWRRRVLPGVASDLLSAGAELDPILPKALRNRPELQARSIVVQDLDMMKVEHVARALLAGSAWDKQYNRGQRTLWGYQALPDGMKKWDDLPQSMYTPTDKADSGHDEPVTREFVRSRYGSVPEELTIEIFDRGRAHAQSCGLVMVDTKFEFGYSRTSRRVLKLGDEVFTPDSSRYLEASALEEYRKGGPEPQSFDKQIVRDYLTNAILPDGTTIDVSKLDPKKAADRALVETIVLPDRIVEQTRYKYLDLLKRLSSLSLAEFGRRELEIAKTR